MTSLEKCDFRPMFEYFEEEKAKKKSLTAAEKKESVSIATLPIIGRIR